LRIRSDNGALPELIGETQVYAQEQALQAILALPETMSYEQMLAVGKAAAQRVAREERERKQEEQEREQAIQELKQRQRVQRERESSVDIFLSINVHPYLLELERAPDGVDFEGKAFQYVQRISADLRPKLLGDPLLNAFTARERIRAAVDEWLEQELSGVQTEEPA